MTDSDCGSDAAAFVLGALEPAEAEAFARHLETCAVCRDEVAAYGVVVDALPLAAPQYEARRALRRRVLGEVAGRGRVVGAARLWRRRSPAARVALAALAVAVLALAFAGGIELGSGGGGSAAARVIRASVGDAELSLSDGHGELIVGHLPAPARGRIYEVWLERGGGAPAPSTLFSVDAHGRADIGLVGDVHGLSHVLVTSEPAGGSEAPTTRPVIVAALG